MKFKPEKPLARIVFLVVGSGSLIWFIFRVIPKPSRATYPCMKAAVPLASSFVTYLIGITGFTLFFRKARERLLKSRYVLASVFACFGLLFGSIALVNNNNVTQAMELQPPQAGNEPIGEGKGIFPGRVVWIHDVDATDETLTNSEGDYWFQDDNTNTDVVSKMLTEGMQHLTGTINISDAWNALFINFNSTHGRGEAGYSPGEKIAIKTNMNNLWYGIDGINTSPQIMYAILDQLVNVVGVNQEDISIGDPNCPMGEPYFNKCSADFPNVIYWNAPSGGNVSYSSKDILFAGDGSNSSSLPKPYVDATYLINIPVFKKHHRAGISITSKNHFGSLGSGAAIWHESLPVPDGSEHGEAANSAYGVYRCFVDIMGHQDLGGKTILFLVDGIWGSTNFSHPPIKWRMSPFNIDFPNSLFLSQDPVAIESVCYDFLYEEFDENHPTEGLPVTYHTGPFARFPGADDFLHQAADPENWPVDVDYDPENDGSVLTSLGAHEHWNNPDDKQYSRNLGMDEGIELFIDQSLTAIDSRKYQSDALRFNFAYPNPFQELTKFGYSLNSHSRSVINIFSTAGTLVYTQKSDFNSSGTTEFTWNGCSASGSPLSAGEYIIEIRIEDKECEYRIINRVVLSR